MTAPAAVVRTIAVALWVGAMAGLDFIDAPLRFATPALTGARRRADLLPDARDHTPRRRVGLRHSNAR
jgi:hypothetical protein